MKHLPITLTQAEARAILLAGEMAWYETPLPMVAYKRKSLKRAMLKLKGALE